MSTINTGAYFCPGTAVTVCEGREQPWQGQIQSMSLSGSTAWVSVVDPLDNPHVVPGEQRVVSWQALRGVRRNRWAR